MRSLGILLLTMTLSCAWAQQQPAAASHTPPAPQTSAPPDQLEPAVDTSAASPKSDAGKADENSSVSGRTPAAPRAAAAAAGSGARAPAKGPDRVDLGVTDITGNRELPKVLYIVPWKHSDIGDLVGKPPNSLLDEVLQPIDRDVFLRENRYYDAVKPDTAAPGAGAVQGSKEKP